ncbi:hypothetical protein ALC53_00006, partial [Atta colombica]
ALSRILNLTVNANKHIPLRAGCHIKFPREIMLKRAVIHVQTADNACFAWSGLISSQLIRKKNRKYFYDDM